MFNKSNIFYGHGLFNSLDEAKIIIFHLLKININLYNKYCYFEVSDFIKKKILKVVNKRIKYKIPLAYLINKSYLYDLEFFVDRNVVIPRSYILEIINNKFKNIINFYPNKILDLCTGSGCLAILAAKIFYRSKVYASDILESIIKIANKNLLINNIKNLIFFISDIYNSIPNIKFDVIITNPPYLKMFYINNLPKEYLYEPYNGLFAKNKGLEFINNILLNSLDFLTERGVLICEVGENYNKLINKYKDLKFNWIKLYKKNNIFFINKKNLKNIKN